MLCHYYQTNQCRSCQWLDRTYPEQLIAKQQHLQTLLAAYDNINYLPPVASPQTACRNRAKMAVSGSTEQPILGLYTADEHAVDLCECPLYSQVLQQAFPILKAFISRAGLTPYQISRQRGELKFILLTENNRGELLLRFVLRSEKKLKTIKQHLAWLLAALPNLVVVSVNLQPIPMAILEGEEEIILTSQHTLLAELNDVPLFIRPKSFFQTNTIVAEQLYATARCWIQDKPIHTLWDLFCGIGGFGLHCAQKQSLLTGIEKSAEAIESASQSAKALQLTQVTFRSLDLTQELDHLSEPPDAVIVNPPRRGLGQLLRNFLPQLAPKFILYSSCNAVSMVADLAYFPDYKLRQVQLFDMFPNTAHYEVLVLLEKSAE